MSRRPAVPRPLLALLAAGAVAAAAADPHPAVARGDAAWQRRAEGQVGGRPRPEPIAEAIAAYEEAHAAAADDLETSWKLQRALFFLGEYVAADDAARLATFARGRDLGELALDRLAAAVGGRRALDRLPAAELASRLPDRRLAAKTYFWTAVHWGLWGRTRGRLAAAREGVAGTIRDYAERVNALDETVENGGGYRLLGRLHTEAPRIPLVTGWVSRETAVAALARARELAPGDLLTRVYQAEAQLAADRDARPQALALLREVAAATPDPAFLVEELAAIADARRLLADLGS